MVHDASPRTPFSRFPLMLKDSLDDSKKESMAALPYSVDEKGDDHSNRELDTHGLSSYGRPLLWLRMDSIQHPLQMMSFVSQALNNGASTSSSNMLQLVPSRKGTLHRRSSVVKSLNTHERSGDFQIAISVSNTCGAWDNAKKYVEAAVIGDTVGDPLKNTSGLPLNILIKLMASESLVFAPFFATYAGLLFKIF
ncbi:hypothetical protein E3N88_33149 [Mikania micrantha]|uniref:H(+)-exporting diphosphatase n=1 Tax=Mikania micrantha TaxID=192012 RepID=A0A5N6MAG7_9ASTR|nr:hypothetical protein E3N88_33149 [Mikania micrantha]